MYKRINPADGVNLTGVFSDKHKTNLLLVSFILPLNSLNAASLNLISKVLTGGTSSHSDFRSLAIACEENYSLSLDAFTHKKGESLLLSFSMSALKNKYSLYGEDIFREGLKLFSEIIFSPFMPEGVFFGDYVNREKESVKELILSLVNNKPAYALRQAVKLMCENEPYAIPSYGDLETLESLDNIKLTEIYKSLISSAPVEIVFTGEYDTDELSGLINSQLPFSPRKYILPEVSRTEKAEIVKTFTKKADASQSTLVLGFRTGDIISDKNYAAFTLFNEVFSQSPISKLFMNVRERLSLCYYCNSLSDRIKGVMTVSAGIDRESFEIAKNAILSELEDIKRGKITEDEFHSALRSALSGYRELYDSQTSVCTYYLSRALSGNIATPEEEMKKISSVRVEDISAIAKNITLDTVFLLEGN